MIKPLLTVIFLTLFLTTHYFFKAQYIIKEYGSMFMMLYMIIDYVCQPEMTNIYKFHHLCSCILCIDDYILDRNDIINIIVKNFLIDTEWSTILFNLYKIYPNKYILYLFPILFIYFRIIKIMYLYYKFINTFVFIRDIPLLSLYGLNVYWLFQIISKFNNKLNIYERGGETLNQRLEFRRDTSNLRLKMSPPFLLSSFIFIPFDSYFKLCLWSSLQLMKPPSKILLFCFLIYYNYVNMTLVKILPYTILYIYSNFILINK